MHQHSRARGFTLIEILVVIGIIAILAAIVIIAINPARQFAQGRNTQRQSNVNTILNAIGQRVADNKGIFDGTITGTSQTCPTLPSTATDIKSSGGVDLSCLTPTYIPAGLPVDPHDGIWTDPTSYDTHYTVVASSTGRVTVCTTEANESALGNPGEICVQR